MTRARAHITVYKNQCNSVTSANPPPISKGRKMLQGKPKKPETDVTQFSRGETPRKTKCYTVTPKYPQGYMRAKGCRHVA